jgi:hypothetical protein
MNVSCPLGPTWDYLCRLTGRTTSIRTRIVLSGLIKIPIRKQLFETAVVAAERNMELGADSLDAQ